ncbi:MAG: GWxTD domain-containing protein [Candidatus Zixiibacteriota bacterium]|nr:MAG: GWxTD domain-containing protein [candidate division Zixibacteria bacterium]
MRILASLSLLCVSAIISAVCVLGQTDFGFLDQSQQIFFVDHAAFREETGERFAVELYYKIMVSALTFVKEGERFRASYELQVVVSNKINKQVTGTSLEEDYVVNSYEETRSPSDFLINQLNLSLYSGRYKLRIRLIDNNSGSVFEQERDFRIPSRTEKKILFSDVQFVRHVADTAGASKFVKKGRSVIPSVSRTFGDTDPTLMFYYEVYGGPDEPESYLLGYQVNLLSGAFSHRETTTVMLGPEVLWVFDSLSLEDFPSGYYSLEIKLWEGDKVKAKTEREFQIDWSYVNLLRNDYLKAIEHLQYAASSDEMKELKKAPEEERLQKWLEFWKSRDPTPNTPENELQDEYYRRLKYVNLNFALPTKEGWETDMGLVYMVYGHPDEVEKHPFDRDVRAFQRWYYYKQNRMFLFVDRGDGEYELQPPYDGKSQYYRRQEY